MSLFYVNTITIVTNQFTKISFWHKHDWNGLKRNHEKQENLPRTAVNNVIAARCFPFGTKKWVCVIVNTKVHRSLRKWVCVIVNTENTRFSLKSSISLKKSWWGIQEFHEITHFWHQKWVCVIVNTKNHCFHRKRVCVIVNTENTRFSSKSSIFVKNPDEGSRNSTKSHTFDTKNGSV